ncbi:hypothetical protein [Nocardia cyriacigeorgica]|uniref:hypothetical protein n=1 Tax=Nocardia cyriacigeorgica TaxID=135487 RepID=UPI002454C8F6|nr:hypothetical protein [Nocardia cyriacigeorgica]
MKGKKLSAHAQACVDAIRFSDPLEYTPGSLKEVLRNCGVNPEGTLGWPHPEDENVLLTMGCSQEYMDIVSEFWRALGDQVCLKSITPLDVLMRGAEILDLPIARQRFMGRYKRLHWAPMAFEWLGPLPSADEFDQYFAQMETRL